MNSLRHLLAASLLCLSACRGAPPVGQACTLIGCSDGITVVVTNAPATAYSVEVILPDGTARTTSCDIAGQCGNGLFVENVSAEQVTIRVSGGGRTTSQVVRPQYAESQPNGPDCPPTCRHARVQVDFNS